MSEWQIIKGGVIRDDRIISIGSEYYKVPHIDSFKIGFKYERTDGYDWYDKVYDSYQYGDVLLLLKQHRIRVLKPWYLRVLIFLKKSFKKTCKIKN